MSSFRGGYAPRRGRGGWAKPFVKHKREQIKLDTEKHPLGQLLETFKNSDLDPKLANPSDGAAISNVHYVTSYNLRDDNDTTILVPGKPPQWTPLKHAQRLPEDAGQYYRDPNAARFPNHPMAPVVQAVLETEANFSTNDVDVVACGSTLGNLLRFVRGQDKPFRFAVETIGRTVFFIRKENDPKEIIEGVRGFGHTFPEAYTTWEHEVKGSDTHQRIIGYDFAGLACLIRFECDGYIKDEAVTSLSQRGTPSSPEADVGSLLSAFGKTAVTKPPVVQSSLERVQTARAGSKISQERIFDLKTRSGKYKTDIDMSDIFPQLWVKQVPNFIVAYHDGAGLFEDIRVKDVRDDVQKWEKEHTDAIRRLAVLLQDIVTFARENKGLLEVCFQGTGSLEVRRQYGEGKHALPSGLRYQWAEKDDVEVYQSDSDRGGQAVSGGYDSDNGWGADSDDEEPDYTACSAEDCGYCGKCSY